MARPLDDIAQTIAQAIVAAIKDREGELTDIAKAGGHEAHNDFLADVGALTDIIGTALEIGLVFDPPAEAALQTVKAAEGAAGKMGRSFGLGYLLGYAAFQMFEPALMPIQQKIATLFQTQQMDATISAEWVTKGILALQDGRNKAHEVNVSDDNFDKLVAAGTTFPDLVTALIMRDRSLITDEMLTLALERHGYPADWLPGLRGLSRQLLSPADLALAFLKGVLDEPTARAYAGILSITPADFDVLVGNTGEPPGVMEMLEAYRRGFIDKDRLEHGIRQGRTRNEWIDVIEALRYAPMSTADAIRAVIENYITEDEGKAIALQNGLLPEHWEPMRQSWGRPLSHDQMSELVHRGLATVDDLKQALRESDIKDKYIDWSVELGRQLVPERTIVSMIDHGVIGHDTGVAMLKEHGFNDTDADALVRLGAAQRTTSHKTLSKGDVLAMYTDALMNRQQATDHLKAIGYQDADVGEMLDLADFKHKATQLRTTERAIEATLKAGHLTADQAHTQLVGAGLDAQQAQSLIDQWQHEKGAVTRSLTEAQIIAAVKALVITPDDGKARLTAMGLAGADVDILWKVHGFIPYANAWTPTPTTPTTAP